MHVWYLEPYGLFEQKGSIMEQPRIHSSKRLLVSCWFPFGFFFVSFWFPFGFLLVSFWFLFGFLLVSFWFLLVSFWFPLEPSQTTGSMRKRRTPSSQRKLGLLTGHRRKSRFGEPKPGKGPGNSQKLAPMASLLLFFCVRVAK